MRLTPSQLAMLQLLGVELPRGEQTLKNRIERGHAQLVRITNVDLKFDPMRWHQHLLETNAGGYRWSNIHLGMLKKIDRAVNDPAWRQAVEELRAGG